MRNQFIVQNTLKVVLLVILLGSSRTIFAQSNVLKLDTNYLDIIAFDARDGLTAGYTTKVVQDSFENMWIGSLAGLNKYNGVVFKTYTNDPVNKKSLSNDDVFPLFTDSYNRLWLVSTNQQAVIYNSKEDVFLPLLYHFTFSSFRDQNGYIWSVKDREWIIAHERDFYIKEDTVRIDATNIHTLENQIDLPKLNDEVALRSIISIIDSTLIFVKDKTLCAYKIDYSTKKLTLIYKTELPFTPNENCKKYGHFIVDKEIGTIHVFNAEQYIAYSLNNGKLLSVFKYPKGIKPFKPHLIDIHHNIWLTDELSNLYRFNPAKSGIEEIRTLNEIMSNFGKNKGVYSISNDKLGNLYFTTTGLGLYTYNISRERFKYIGDRHLGPPMNLFSLKNGDVIVKNDLQLSLFNKGTSKLDLVFGDKKNNPNNAMFFYEDDKNTSYIILSNHFVKKIDYIYQLNKEYKPMLLSKSNTNLYEKTWHSYYLLHQNDYIWTVEYYKSDSSSTIKKPMIVFSRVHPNRKSDTFNDTLILNKTQTHYGDHFGKFLKGKNGDVWIANSETGLIRYNIESKVSKIYEPTNNNNTIPSNVVYDMLIDPFESDSILWFGSNKGLCRFNYKKEQFTIFNTAHGLPNNVIYGILSDKRNNLWLSSNQGLSLFNPKTLEIRNFEFTDGLQHSEFNKFGTAKDNEGILYFSGVGGLTYFNPEDFYKKTKDSKINIYAIKVLNHELEYNENEKNSNQYLTQPIELTKDIIFTNEDKMITFQFALMDLSSPSKNKYRYKLSGLSDEWIELGNKSEVTFINLAPGTYTFTVNGANHDGHWSQYTKDLNFKVLGPWWKKTWFYLLLISVVFFTIVIFFRQRENNRQILHTLRNKISRNLHDDIGSTMSSISLFGTVAQKHVHNKESIEYKMLQKINESANQVMEAINDIVWAINADNDKLVNVIQRMRTYLSSLSDASDIKIISDFQQQVYEISLDMVERRNLYLIFKECVNNAIKYSQALELKISLYEKDGWIHLNVVDNGIGFDQQLEEEKLSLGGNGLKNIKNRSEELSGKLDIISTKDAGTKIYFKFKIKK